MACGDAMDRDGSRKLAFVEAPTVLDRCRLLVNAALGIPVKMTARMTARRMRHEAGIKSNYDSPKPLMIEWESATMDRVRRAQSTVDPMR